MPPFARTVPIALLLALASIAVPARVHAGGSCCQVAQVATAEARLPVQPFNPRAAVWSVTRLNLVNVQVFAAGANASVHRPNGDNTIQYVFGYTPPTHGNLFVRPRPHFVVVTEIVEQRRPGALSITPVLPAPQHPPIPAGYQSPLELVAPLPRRHLTFAVESNIPRSRLHLLGQLLLRDARSAGGGPAANSPGSRNPWIVNRVLAVPDVASLCASHPSARFVASVRGYLTATALNGPGGGWVGRLFTVPNPHAFFAGDTRPFVQVWGTKAWLPGLSGRQVSFHGILACDASRYAADLPGWRGSITPDRYSVIAAGAPSSADTVPCHTVILEGGLTCYPPRAQARAEAQLAVRPIDPAGIVEAATHLQLTQLRVFYGFRRHGAVNLLYGFGQVCWSSEFTCATRYLVVGEAPGPSPVPGPRLVRDREASSGSGIRYGPWKYLAPVPGRNLVITVYGPFPKVTIQRIGSRIVGGA